MHEINGMALLVIDELLDDKEEIYTFIEETRESLQFLKDGLLSLGVESSQSVANFLVARFGRYFSGEELSRRLKEESVLIRMPFREEYLKEWTRIGTDSKEIMQKVINVAKEMVKESEVL
jgi:histidinol-phosphate/aromatic aminotransferase/cobyric acid decarboxylase-like protein